MFYQILLEIEQELGIKFSPMLYCPYTLNPTRRVFVDESGTIYNISEEMINFSTWTVLVGTEGHYIYDICVKTMIKDAVIRTMVNSGLSHPHKKTQNLIKFKIKKHKING